MRLRLALAATVAVLAAGPFVTASHAFACNEEMFPEACEVWYRVCAATHTCRLFG